MRLLFLASAAILATAAGAATPAQPTDRMPVVNPIEPIGKLCPPTSRTEAARRGGRLQARNLNELPLADMYMAVDRRVDGCQAPIIAGYGFGGGHR
ncbi:hypothetical protein [Sphingomonas sp.]|uniref:hypothetical protein n=1 Tax=Sphingomonas sp. TaxID=28214 RepID=UPI0025D288E8|nr:hypothetical protein [Sphingomonas sp.]MBV9527042.1 hypothetical protein [Sphingomonas sp.]